MADVEVSVGFKSSDLSSMESQLNALVNKEYKLKVDTADAEAKIRALFETGGGGSGGKAKEVKVSTAAAEKSLNTLENKIAALEAKSTKMRLGGTSSSDLSNLNQQIGALQKVSQAYNNSGKSVQAATDAYSKMRSILTQVSSEIQKLSAESSVNKVFDSLGTSIDSMSSKISSLQKNDITGKMTSGIASEIEKIEDEYKSLINRLRDPNDSLTENSVGAIQTYEQLEQRLAAVSKKATDVSGSFAKMNAAANISSAVSQVDTLIRSLENAGPSFNTIRDRLNQIKASLQYGSYEGNLSKLKTELSGIKSEIESLQGSIGNALYTKMASLFNGIGNIIKGIAVANATQFIRQALEQIYSNVVEINTSMTQLKIVTGATDSEMEVFFNRSAEAAQRFGASVTEVLDSVQVFSRLGYNLEDSLDLSSYATILSNTAAVSVDEATTGLTAIIKGYNLDVSEAEHVSDVLIDVGQKYAISAGELMEAFQRGGAALHASGTDFNESAALLAAANAAIQDASTIGTALKTVSARIRGATSELSEMGEETENLGEGLSKYREEIKALTSVDIMADATAGEYKSIYQIFTELAKIWGTLSDTTQSRVAEILGGTRQLSVISSIINNISDAEGAYTVALEANGVAQKSNQIYLDSVEGRISQLQSSWEVFSKDFMSSDLIKFGATALNDVVGAADDLVNVFGAMPTVLAAISLKGFISNFSKLKDLKTILSDIISTGRNTGDSIGALNSGLNLAGFTTGFSKLALGVGVATTAISAGMAIWNAGKHYLIDVPAQAADEASQSFETMATDIDDYKSRIAELKTSLASNNLSSQEQYDVKSQLVSIQSELISKYGEEAAALDLLTASSDTYIGKLDAITKGEATRNLAENRSAYERAERKMTEGLSYNFSYAGLESYASILKAFEQISDEYSNIAVFSPDSVYGPQITISGNVEEAQKALEALYSAMLDIDDVSDIDASNFNYFLDLVSSGISDTEKIISEYKDRYQEYLIQATAADKVAGPIGKQIADYADALKDAIANGQYALADGIFYDLANLDLSGVEDENIRNYLQGLIDAACSEEYRAQIKLSTEFVSGNKSYDAFLEYLNEFTNNGAVDLDTIKTMEVAGVAGYDSGLVSAFANMSVIANHYGMSVSELVAHLSSLGEVQVTVADGANKSAASLLQASDTVDRLTSSYSSFANVLDEMAGGGLSISTATSIMKDLVAAGKDYTKYLYAENGQLKLNTAAFLEYTNAANKAEFDKAVDRRDELESQITNARQLAQVDRTKESWENVYALQEEYNQLSAQIEIYEALTDSVNTFYKAYSSGVSKLSSVSDIITAIQTGGATQSQALEWIASMPELATYYDAATNSFSDLDGALTNIVESDVNSYIDSLNQYLEENPELSDAARASILSLAEAYKTAADETLNTGKAFAVLNKNVTTGQKPFKQLRTQIKNLWNADVFSDARQDLVELAKKAGITAADITDLAEDNIYLQAMLQESGVSASYLAEIFEQLSLQGEGALDNITEDAVRVNTVLSEMDGSLARVTAAYEKYQSTLGTWEYDDGFNNYVEAYKNLGEMFGDGTYGADFYRTIDYLYGEGHGADSIESLYQAYKNLGQIFSEDDNGLGFIEKLYDAQASLGGDWIKLDSNGNYIWNIGPEDFAGIAEGLGMTEEQVAACVEALGMFGDFTEYDPDALIGTFKDLNMALIDTQGSAVLSEQAVRDMLETLGLESWEIDKVVASLKEAEGIELFSSSDTEDAQQVVSLLSELGQIKVDGDKIWLSALTSSLHALGMSGDDISEFLTTLNEAGYSFTNSAGGVVEFSDALSRIDGTPLENVKQEAIEAQDALNKLNMLNLDVDFDSTDMNELNSEFARLIKMRNTLVEEDGTIKVGFEDSYNNITQMMYALQQQKNSLSQPFFMELDTTSFEGDIYTLIADLQSLYSLTQEKVALINIGADTSEVSAVQGEIDSVVANIQSQNPEVLATVGLDSSSSTADMFEAMSQMQTAASTREIMLKVGVNETEVSTFLNESHDDSATVIYRKDSSAVDSYNPKNYTRWVTYRKDSTSVDSYNPRNYTRYVTYYNKNGSGNVNGTAHMFGTAHAHGNWGTGRDETALTGELGPEIVVNGETGTWYTVGDIGAEFVSIPKGSIVFNHKQTKDLLSHGYAIGRGKAYASGTIPIRNPVTGEYYSSSYSGNSSGYSSSSSSSSYSSATDSAEEFSEQLDWIEVLLDRIERKISRLDTVASSTFNSFSDRSTAVANNMSAITEEIDAQAAAYQEYLWAAEQVNLPGWYKDLVANGAVALETITNEDLNDAISEYRELYEKALDSQDAIVELNEKLRQLYKDQFDLVTTRFDAILDSIDNRHSILEEYVSQIEESGHIVSSKYYELLISNERETLKGLVDEKNRLMDALSSAVDSGAIERYSEAWYEMNAAIEECEKSIASTNTEITTLNNNIRQLRWDRFDDMRDAINQITDETDFLADILGRGNLFGDNGLFNDAGSTTLGLNVQKYNTYMSQVTAYGEEIKKVEQELARDLYNTDLIDRIQELTKAQRDAATSALDEKDAIVDLVKQGIEIQIDVMSDLIDKYKGVLDSTKDAFDYQNKISKQTKELSSLQKQLNAYSGDTSEEAKKTIQELTASIAEAESDLRETQYDQYISDQKKLLDDLYDSYSEVLNARLDNVDALIADMTNVVNGNTSTICTTLQKAADSVGVVISDNIASIWNNDTYNNQLTGFYDIYSAILATVQDIEAGVNKKHSQSSETGIVAQMKQNSIGWYTASDSERESIHYQNIALANQLSALTGDVTYQENGVWYGSDGNPLYTIEKADIIDNIVAKMKENAAEWWNATDQGRKSLSEESLRLGETLGSVTGQSVWRDGDGVWWIDGKKLFDVYHSGGLVGGGNMTDKERLAVLLGDEAVLTNSQLEAASARVTEMGDILKRIGALQIPNPVEYVSGQIPSVISTIPSSAVNTVNNNTFDVTFTFPEVKNYEEFMNALRSDRKFEKLVQSITVDRIAGKSNMSKNVYKWQ